MSRRRILTLVCPIACAACLVAGYASAAQWMGMVVVLLTFLAWPLARQRSSLELTSMALVISVGLAAAGLFAGAPPILMLLSATLALASWDLMHFDRTLIDLSSTSRETIALFENRHSQSLGLALGLGWLAAVIGQLIRLQIPLGGMIFLTIVALFSLDRLWHALAN